MKKLSILVFICLFISILAACSEKNVEQTDTIENPSEVESDVDTPITVDPKEDEEEELIVEENHESSDGIDHHDELPYEWSASYPLETGTYTLVLNQNEFGDESMLIAFILENKNIKDLEHHAAHLFEALAEEVPEHTKFHAKHEFIYNLMLNTDASQFTFNVEETGNYVLFTEHHAEEFLMQILDESGEEIVPENETEYEGHGHSHDH